MDDITAEARHKAQDDARSALIARWEAASARRKALVDEVAALVKAAGIDDDDVLDDGASPDGKRLMIFLETVTRLSDRAVELEMFDHVSPEWSLAAEEIMRLLVAFARDGLRA